MDELPASTGGDRTYWRWAGITIFAALLGVILTIILTRQSDVSLASLLDMLKLVDPYAFGGLLAATAAYVFVGSEKWRIVDTVLRHDSQPAVSRSGSFAMTSVGMTIGFFFPLQVGPVLARTLGTWLTGHRPLIRGTVGTLIEQAFDLLIVLIIALVCGVALALGLAPLIWVSAAIAVVGGFILLVGHLFDLAARWATRMDERATIGMAGRTRWALLGMKRAGFLQGHLARILCMVSAGRFVLLVIMADCTTAALRMEVSVWHLAGAMPFAILATALAPTPAGLGINEWTYSSFMHAFGTPMDMAVRWAIANRILVMTASIVIAVVASAYVIADRLRRKSPSR